MHTNHAAMVSSKFAPELKEQAVLALDAKAIFAICMAQFGA
jgi:hypothetical protein